MDMLCSGRAAWLLCFYRFFFFFAAHILTCVQELQFNPLLISQSWFKGGEGKNGHSK